MAYMLGAPAGDPGWKDVGQSANAAIEQAEDECKFPPLNPKNGRGNYPVLSTGFSYGGGPTRPSNRALNRLVQHQSFVRLSGHTNGSWMYRHLDKVLGDILTDDPSLRKPFTNSVFPVATFNFRPVATTVPHCDSRNVPYGCSCCGTSKYLIEFPPGSTILIPSSVLTHSNTRIQPGETRRSFTQHCSGSLVRWWMYGFRTEANMAREDPAMAEKVRAAAGRC
ncbi:hypothetical protein FA95DRAFT_1585507 [Auriscalpium vulgare]|uniref:Uncharacterized protein n=1 Tax=Auriscalpium vulgare TaxID=40419 RepID=A0ACB8R213_9AGAM|nr:hypothetical protein FA95DRAFT_1585507 [Auriscalpium vulgare]